MESGWLVNSNLSNSEVSAASLPGRSYRISPITLPSGHALLHGRRSTIPHGFGTVCARACSIAKALTSYSTETTYFGHSAAAKSSEPSEPTARIGRTDRAPGCPDGASADLGGALGTYRRSLDTRFHGHDQCGHTVEAAPNRRANGRARLASQTQLSGPQESVTALRKLRMRTPWPAGWPDGWCVKPGLL